MNVFSFLLSHLINLQFMLFVLACVITGTLVYQNSLSASFMEVTEWDFHDGRPGAVAPQTLVWDID